MQQSLFDMQFLSAAVLTTSERVLLLVLPGMLFLGLGHHCCMQPNPTHPHEPLRS